MPVSISGTNGVTFPDSSLQAAAASPYVLKNRIINGDMVVDQRNNGASVTPASGGAGTYTLDRWNAYANQSSKYTVQQNAGSITPPTGFTNYLGATSSSAYSIASTDLFLIRQHIEGFNVADLGWGTANAQTVTLSFRVRSSLTGTFGGLLQNSAQNRNYPFTYTISVANTWEQKTITIAGDTTGTWLTTNGIGITVNFGLGVGSTYSGPAGAWSGTTYYGATGATSVVGTNGATFYITGVQLEQNTSATPFERRLYGQELANCQRYYYRLTLPSGTPFGSGYNKTTTTALVSTTFPVTLRTSTSALEQSGTASNYRVNNLNTATNCSSVPTIADCSIHGANINLTVASGLTAGNGCIGATSTDSYLAWNVEL